MAYALIDAHMSFLVTGTLPLSMLVMCELVGRAQNLLPYKEVISFCQNGNPKADAMLTYSESTDPASPHFDDYTKAYSDKNWLTLPFTEEQIKAQQIAPTLVLREALSN